MTSPEPESPARSAGVIRLAELRSRDARSFTWEPDAETRAALAAELGLSQLKKLRLAGRLTPVGRQDWDLTATLGASVVQPCVATLVPVTTRIDEEVVRRYRARLPDPVPGETEMPEDDALEALPAEIDLAALGHEALALAIPPFPRAPEAPPVELSASPPGAEGPEGLRPFAGLAALRDKLSGEE